MTVMSFSNVSQAEQPDPDAAAGMTLIMLMLNMPTAVVTVVLCELAESTSQTTALCSSQHHQRMKQ